ncbi:putative late blight resistance protein -like protein R1A-3-like [Capsicum annuum]|nr:putative late blight resistance protein -like protein R1A-3-like [Capsicum annuum]
MEVVETYGEGPLSSEVYSTRHSFTSTDVDEVAGFEKDTKNIMKKLTGGTKELDVLSIFGMLGLEKTTLSRKVYNNIFLVNYFDAKAWYDISQEYNRRTLLVEIFKQVRVDKNEIKEDVDIADELQKTLKGKRYLIVLDDIWEVGAWEDLGLCFPKGGQIMKVIQSSYDHLEDHLKYCLLYIELFSEDYKILVLDLIKLWMAIEYVLNVDKEDMEEASIIFLNDLLNIILVMVSHGSSNVGVTYSTLHDVVRKFCLRKLTEEKFIQLTIPYNPYQYSYSMELQLSIYIHAELVKQLDHAKYQLDKIPMLESKETKCFGECPV